MPYMVKKGMGCEVCGMRYVVPEPVEGSLVCFPHAKPQRMRQAHKETNNSAQTPRSPRLRDS
jgi:hypothetical protein